MVLGFAIFLVAIALISYDFSYKQSSRLASTQRKLEDLMSENKFFDQLASELLWAQSSKDQKLSWRFDGQGRYRLFVMLDGTTSLSKERGAIVYSPITWLAKESQGYLGRFYAVEEYLKAAESLGIPPRVARAIHEANDRIGNYDTRIRDRLNRLLHIPSTISS